MTIRAAAPVEDVWKLLHEPSSFPHWWAGIETVEPGDAGAFTMWPSGYPDYPMRQQLSEQHNDRRVTISCLVSYLEFVWQLADDGDETTIDVHVTLPEAEAHRLEAQRAVVAESLERLARLAAGSGDSCGSASGG